MPEHSSFIAALILERPVCLPCLSKRAHLSEETAETALTVIQRALQLRREDISRCRECGVIGVVYYIDRPQVDDARGEGPVG